MSSAVVRSKGRPVRSLQPYELLRVLDGGGVDLRVVGSCRTGAPARDLDVVVDCNAANLARLKRALAEIGLGEWRRGLECFAENSEAGVVSIHTVFGPLDLHSERRT